MMIGWRCCGGRNGQSGRLQVMELMVFGGCSLLLLLKMLVLMLLLLLQLGGLHLQRL